jgi:two-component system LytT family sensor kinase
LLYQQRKDKILQLRGAEKALTKSKADLQFLRSQINPHFLFNILNTLYGTALREQAKDTAAGVQKLGDMMRFMLRDNHLDFIPMNSEVSYLKNYISLQKLRVEPDADIMIEENISDDKYGHLIAPMLLIPFVENAFKHGINPLDRSWIKINLSCDRQQIYFEVRNSVFPAMDNRRYTRA